MFKKPNRTVKRVFIHCTASDSNTYNNVESIRKDHKNRGWNDIGYHYLITKTGEIQYGRNLETTPAAQKNHNTNSIAICVAGNKNFSEISLQTLKLLCQEINETYDKNNQKNILTFHGHCEVNKEKTCPNFNYKKLLNLDKSGYILEEITAKQTESKTTNNQNNSNINNQNNPIISTFSPVQSFQSMSFLSKMSSLIPTIANAVANPAGATGDVLTKMFGTKDKKKIDKQLSTMNIEQLQNLNSQFEHEVKLAKINLEHSKIDSKNLTKTIDDKENARSHFDHDKRLFWPMITIIFVIATFGFLGFFHKLENGNRDFLYSILGQLTTVLGTMATFFYGASIINGNASKSNDTN